MLTNLKRINNYQKWINNRYITHLLAQKYLHQSTCHICYFVRKIEPKYNLSTK